MFHVLLGLNGLSLVVIKESGFVMYSTLISAMVNVVLNVMLIPTYGIEGAAIATAISYFVTNVLNSFRLYQKFSHLARTMLRLLAVSSCWACLDFAP